MSEPTPLSVIGRIQAFEDLCQLAEAVHESIEEEQARLDQLHEPSPPSTPRVVDVDSLRECTPPRVMPHAISPELIADESLSSSDEDIEDAQAAMRESRCRRRLFQEFEAEADEYLRTGFLSVPVPFPVRSQFKVRTHRWIVKKWDIECIDGINVLVVYLPTLYKREFVYAYCMKERLQLSVDDDEGMVVFTVEKLTQEHPEMTCTVTRDNGELFHAIIRYEHVRNYCKYTFLENLSL